MLASRIYSKNCISSRESISAGFLTFSSAGKCIVEKSCFINNSCIAGTLKAHDIKFNSDNLTVFESSILYSHGNLGWCATISCSNTNYFKMTLTNQTQNVGTSCIAGYSYTTTSYIYYNYYDSNNVSDHMTVYFGNSKTHLTNSVFINNVVHRSGILLIEAISDAYFANLSLIKNTAPVLFSHSTYEGRPRMTIERCSYIDNTINQLTDYGQNDPYLNSSFIGNEKFILIIPHYLAYCEKRFLITQYIPNAPYNTPILCCFLHVFIAL